MCSSTYYPGVGGSSSSPPSLANTEIPMTIHVYTMACQTCACMSSLHFSRAVVWFGQTVALLEKAQDIMIGDGLVWKVTFKKKRIVHTISASFI